ncbi:MAG: alkaline phosphatase family protein [Actinomycetota bacterium]|nr:alkaline phosphatase family protein [Actinomycetota bacterium]
MNRDLPPATAGPGADRAASAAAALEVLCAPELAPVVEMVLTVRSGAYEAHSADGRVRFRRHQVESNGTSGSATSVSLTYEILSVEGVDPLADQSPDRFAGYDAEEAGRFPARSDNAYPHGYEQVAQFFDAPMAPDLCVVHSAAHNYEDRGGHRGEHGSLDVVQARAPFVLAGKGVRSLGTVDRSCRLIDVAPTLAALMGLRPGAGVGLDGRPRSDAYLARQDGEALTDLLDAASARPRHVVGFLLDGCNPNTLYRLAASGAAPNVARLMDMGTAFRHGAMAGMPTVTLANHTSVLTGAYPGHHHILHNAWWDRVSGEVVTTNSPATWPSAMRRLAPGIETLFAAVRRDDPAAFTAAVNEPVDTGAAYSTFDFFRRGEIPTFPQGPEDIPHATLRFAEGLGDYRFNTLIDHMAMEQAVGLWRGRYLGQDYRERPKFTWVSFQLTDAAFHAGGPRSEIAAAAVADTDGRIGEILAAIEAAGALENTAFLLVADHGMEETDPGVRGDWDAALAGAGVSFRDEGAGFIYLDPVAR